MKIRNLFAKDIDRKINPAVVVAEQDQNTIQTEIEEYVFTKDLIDNLYKFLDALINRKDGKTAIWINGYYGSGKSHFIKYVHYCINPDTSELAFDHFVKNAQDLADSFSNATPSNILQLQKRVGNSDIHNIMFNIDAVSGQKNDKNKLAIIILNQFNEFRGYNKKNIPLALLVEKHLDKLGLFDEFKTKVNKLGGYNWEADAATLVSLKLDKVLDVVLELDPSIDRDSLRNKLKNPDDITIEGDLLPQFLEYLEDKPEDYRLVFLVDEVSQYIGSNTNLLLNLQTIIEEVGSKCNNKVWFATTAQQSLDQVIKSTEISGEDFGKILGRFEIRISLQSQDAAYITKKRILDKASSGLGELKTFYDTNKDAIHNQFNFSSNLYQGYTTFEEFALSYPFVPYQFRLISDVFDSFSHLDYVIKEVKDNERSVLGITHFTVKNFGDQDLSFFVPFDGFFNEQFRSNLTHTARSIIDRAMQLDAVKNDAFAKRVVFTLFMISNLSDSKKIVFPANLDNLTTLLIDTTDANRLDSQKSIQQVLEKLTAQSIIREENGQYHFFKEDEIEVANLINNQNITMEDRLKELHDSIFSPMLSLRKKVAFGNSSFDLNLAFDNKQIYPSGDVEVIFSFYNDEDIDQRAMKLSRDVLVFCVNQPMKANVNLMQEFNQLVKTKVYLRNNYDNASGQRKKTLDDFTTRNNSKLDELKKSFAGIYKTAPVISAQQIVKPTVISASDPKTRYDEAIKHHFDNVYKKHDLAKSYATSPDDLKKAALSKQTSLDKTLTTAEDEVHTWAKMAGNVADVVRYFEDKPYGWKDLATVHILVMLAKKEKLQFEWKNEKVDQEEFYKQASKKQERTSITIHEVEPIDVGVLNDIKNAYRHIFNEDLIPDLDAKLLFHDLFKKLDAKMKLYRQPSIDYSHEPFGISFQTFNNLLEDLIPIRDPARLFKEVIEKKEELKSARDIAKELLEFIDNQYHIYQKIKDFNKLNQGNYEMLTEEDRKKGFNLAQYLNHEQNPADKFPEMRKIYEELEKLIKDQKAVLRENALKVYQEMEANLKDLEKVNKVSDKEAPSYGIHTIVETLKNESSIATLQLALERSDTRQAEALSKIGSLSGKKSVTVKISQLGLPSTIESDSELENYITNLKAKLKTELDEGKTIIVV
jgi:hypothetical protein